MNLYNIEQCEEAISVIRSIDSTVRKKVEHTSKVWEIHDVICKYVEPINKYVLAPDELSGFKSYYTAVTKMYKETTKKQLDGLLKLALINICTEINSCIRIENAILSGKLVEHPTKKGYWVEKEELK